MLNLSQMQGAIRKLHIVRDKGKHSLHRFPNPFDPYYSFADLIQSMPVYQKLIAALHQSVNLTESFWQLGQLDQAGEPEDYLWCTLIVDYLLTKI